MINPDGSYGDWLYTVTYYDERFNPVQIVRNLYDLGGTERVTRSLRFDGRVEKEIVRQEVTTGNHSVEKTFSYDHADRLLSTRLVVRKGDEQKKDITLVANRYNGIGLLKDKYLHSTNANNFRQQLTHSFTPRGWMKKVDGQTGAGNNFGIELRYTDPQSATAQYNGNIAEMLWRRSGTGWVGYRFSYDAANRLTGSEGINNSFKETGVNYDKNGNINNLQRHDGNTQWDDLHYTYDGNRLMKVTDAMGNSAGFSNGGSADNNDYSYDGNGNATQDLNKGINGGGIEYNLLNLLRKVTINGNVLQYHYDASGAKLRMSNSNGSVNTKYLGAFEYDQNNYLTRIATEEGQITVTGNGASYDVQYYLRDHQNNVRMVINEAGTIVEETEYFPFGLAIPRSGTDAVNNYQFLNREKQPETGWMDLMKRSYDPTISRFLQVDPVTKSQEQLSVYQYGWNNPIRYSDPNGDCPICDDFKKLYNGAMNYLTQNASMYAKGSAEVTDGYRLALGIGKATSRDGNAASDKIVES